MTTKKDSGAGMQQIILITAVVSVIGAFGLICLSVLDAVDVLEVPGQGKADHSPVQQQILEPKPTLVDSTDSSGTNVVYTNSTLLTLAVDDYVTSGNDPVISISDWDVSSVQDFSSLFSSERNPVMINFTGNISTWDVSNAVDMSFMFAGAESFDSDISTWTTSKVVNMSHMFDNAGSFNGAIGNWNVSSVLDMSYMFTATEKFTGAGLDNWSVSNSTNVTGMFCEAVLINPFYVADLYTSDVSC